jgi:ABC-type microcin C transport system permease subunit YejE
MLCVKSFMVQHLLEQLDSFVQLDVLLTARLCEFYKRTPSTLNAEHINIISFVGLIIISSVLCCVRDKIKNSASLFLPWMS